MVSTSKAYVNSHWNYNFRLLPKLSVINSVLIKLFVILLIWKKILKPQLYNLGDIKNAQNKLGEKLIYYSEFFSVDLLTNLTNPINNKISS